MASSVQLMPFAKFLQKATNLLGFANTTPLRAPPPIDGEIVYSKNNVCIHQTSGCEVKQIPGYFTLRCQSDDVCGATLVLTWVPNRTIKINPRSVESSPLAQAPAPTPAHRPTIEKCMQISAALSVDSVPALNGRWHTQPSATDIIVPSSDCSLDDGTYSNSNSGEHIIRATVTRQPQTVAIRHQATAPAALCQQNWHSNGSAVARPRHLDVASSGGGGSSLLSDGTSILSCPSSSGSTEGPDSPALTTSLLLSSFGGDLALPSSSFLIGITEAMAEKRDLALYESLQTAAEKKHQLPVFCVDLGLMKSLRLFYCNDECTCGQLVVASRESQYKIFHFYYGGLDKLAEVLNDWNLFNEAKMKQKLANSQSKLFQVVRPKVPDGQGHPEEGYHGSVTPALWLSHMNEHGQICDELTLRRDIFFGGLDPSLRREVWPFLLSYYPFESTFEQREQLRAKKYREYQEIRTIKDLMNKEEKDIFWRSIQNIVEKDVVRTDRLHPYYAGDGNPNVDMLKELLLNYAAAQPKLGYSQGMSDLLAPLLAEMRNEADVYWCFVGLMQRTIFVSSPRDVDMDRQLTYLKELLRLMVPKFYYHLKKVGESLGLLFVHRWILLCFKREFQERDAMSVWESCWTHYQTDYFHLFVCAAIVALYGDDVVNEQLPADEMLLHFGSLAMHMNCRIVLKKARGLLHQFRLLETIPCTLIGLCTLCGAGMWDSGHVPAVECVGDHGADGCPNMGLGS